MTLARMAAVAASAAGRSLHQVGKPGFRTCQRRFACMGPFRGKQSFHSKKIPSFSCPSRAYPSGGSFAVLAVLRLVARRAPVGRPPMDPLDLAGSASDGRVESTDCTCWLACQPGRDWLPVSLLALGRVALAVQVRCPSAA